MLKGLLRTMRPHQWVKNGFVLAPLVFARELGHIEPGLRAAFGFALFCLASSTVYVINDIADVEADRAHPIKSKRPIASGLVSLTVARAAAVSMACLVLVGGALLDLRFLGVVAGYLVMNLAYSFRLKRVAYVDVSLIAMGFELRVLGGAFAADVPPTPYLLVVTGLLALFLGFGKRLHELLQGERAMAQRKALSAYQPGTLKPLLSVTGLATVVTYVVYALDPSTRAAFGTDYLVGTSVMPAFGVWRFLMLVQGTRDSESPTEAMLRDWPFLLNLVLWAVSVVGVIYLGQG